ncbi:hypothetical protein ACFL1R_00520 [Candidatus Latescibacterota bacterium]
MRVHVLFPIILVALSFTEKIFAGEQNYNFDGKISRKVLENYLDRSITMQGFLHDEKTSPGFTKAQSEDNIRMIMNIGAKFIGRAFCVWGNEPVMVDQISKAVPLITRIHNIDPDIILQGTLFEIMTSKVSSIPVPEWVFREFYLEPENRTFNYDAMLYQDKNRMDEWGKGLSVPDMKQLETRMWFFYIAASYIDVGIEAIHFGQIRLMDDRDPDLIYWRDILRRIRHYALRNARRHWVLCDSHTPHGDSKSVVDGMLLFDFNSFIMKVQGLADSSPSGELRMGAMRTVYGRSPGGMTPSGWECDHIPYLIEIDNYGYSGRGGEFGVGSGSSGWIWGYDEITWFANKDTQGRNQWLRYSWNWIREHDSNGHFEMPGSRTISSHIGGKNWYFANTASDAFPDGFNQEETIKLIWLQDE